MIFVVIIILWIFFFFVWEIKYFIIVDLLGVIGGFIGWIIVFL